MVNAATSGCSVTPCYFSVGVASFGNINATYSLLVSNASSPVYLVRGCGRLI